MTLANNFQKWNQGIFLNYFQVNLVYLIFVSIELLVRVRMIWEKSKFYKTSDKISGLLHKISNEIIKRCRAEISIKDMLDGDVERCIEKL